MKNKDWTAKLVSELIEKRIFDDKAQTIEEIAAGAELSARSAYRKVMELIKSGTIEKVWKRGSLRPVAAYRIKK